jgi:hypothetical protein
MRFQTWFVPSIDPLPAGTRILVEAGALDKSLRLIHAGRRVATLTLGHDGPDIATTADVFSLFVSGDKLLVRINGNGAAGRYALRVIATSGDCQLSIQLKRCKYIRVKNCPVPSIIIMEGNIEGVAVVPSGACPGCRLLF